MQIRKIISLITLNTFIGLITYSYLYFSQIGEFPDFFEDLFFLGYLVFGANAVGFLIYTLNSFLNNIPFWQRKIGLRFALGVLINFISIILILYLCIQIYLLVFNVNTSVYQLFELYQEIAVRIFILTLVLVIFLVVSDFLIYSYKYYSQGQIQIARLKREQMELKFEALRTQLSPHYLFNSLNTISSLIYQDLDLTEQYIRKLAGTYKYILDSDSKALIPLKDEIEFVKDYYYLLNIRFGDAFQVHFSIDDKYMNTYIPPISIQILIENAVKHNVFDENDPLKVSVVTVDNMAVVQNKIMKAPSDRESFKIGLGNIRKRYEVFTDKKINIVKDEYFKVELPLLKKASND